MSRHLEIVQRLVTNGANINAKDLRGDTPLHKATDERYLMTCEGFSLQGREMIRWDDLFDRERCVDKFLESLCLRFSRTVF